MRKAFPPPRRLPGGSPIKKVQRQRYCRAHRGSSVSGRGAHCIADQVTDHRPRTLRQPLGPPSDAALHSSGTSPLPR